MSMLCRLAHRKGEQRMASAHDDYVLRNGPKAQEEQEQEERRERSPLTVKATKKSLRPEPIEPEIKVNVYYTDADEEVHRVGSWVGVAWDIDPEYSDEEDEDSGNLYVIDWRRGAGNSENPWITLDEIDGEPFGPGMERDYTHYNYRASQSSIDHDVMECLSLNEAKEIQKELAWAIRYIEERQYEQM